MTIMRAGWREEIWSNLDQPFDLIVIGGGITGAGILRESARAGLRVLLVEANDFASGTSSRSSKLVHGGLRYLKSGDIKTTLESVHERERLLREGRGLINPLGYVLANFKSDPIPKWMFGAALIFYDLLAQKWNHRHYNAHDLCGLCPFLPEDELNGGYRYIEAQTDDARLVLRVIQEAIQDGGFALNYAAVIDLLRSNTGRVCGVVIQDNAQFREPLTGSENRVPSSKFNQTTCEVEARVVINATGAWADDIRQVLGGQPRLRKLRGSHLIFPHRLLPVTRSIGFFHPKDGRPVFLCPWEGVTLVGTTDVDHTQAMSAEPTVSEQEIEYLLAAVRYAYPRQEITHEQIQVTFSGVRPVVNTGKADPSKESREHVFWLEDGLLTVAGGKLTTFRLMAHQALHKVRTNLLDRSRFDQHQRILAPSLPDSAFPEGLPPATRLRLSGRYGNLAALLVDTYPLSNIPIPGTPTLWSELLWAAHAEGIIHLEDLLLRRTRLGLTLPHGATALLPEIRALLQDELCWSDARWEQEEVNYRQLIDQHYLVHSGEIRYG